MAEQWIAFNLDGEAAACTRRAAAALKLTVLEGSAAHERAAGATLVVMLHSAIDAYRLAELTASDPAWARAFLRR